MPRVRPNQKVQWKIKDTLLEETSESSEEFSIIRNLKATIRGWWSQSVRAVMKCPSLSLRGQGRVQHSMLQPSEAPTEMLNSSSALAETITPVFGLRGMAQRKFIPPLP